MQKLACPRHGVWGLTFSPDGDMLAGISREPFHEALYCWTRSRGWEKSGLRGRITAVTFHPGGRALAYSGHPFGAAGGLPADPDIAGVVRLYPLTPACQFEPDRLTTQPAGAPPAAAVLWAQKLAFAPDGRTLLANRFEHRGLFSRSRPAVIHWHFTPDGDRWRAADAAPSRTAAERGAALVGEGCLAVVGVWGVLVCPLDPTASSPLLVPDVSRATVVAVAQRGELLAAAEGRTLRVWHLREPNPVAAWASPPLALYALAFSPDGRTLATGDSEPAVSFRDPLTGGQVAEYDFGVGPVQSLAYAPDGLTLAVAGRNGLVVVDVG